MMVHYICSKEIVHNGTRYRPGQAWDGDPPAPEVGTYWSILQSEEPDPGPQPDGVIISSSRANVGWKPQPGRPQTTLPTEEEKKQFEEDPYDLKRKAAEEAAVPAPVVPDTLLTAEKKKSVKPTMPFQNTQEEIDDPYGLRKKAKEEDEARVAFEARRDEKYPPTD